MAQERERLLSWASGMTLDNIIINVGNSDVDTIGSRLWIELTVEVHKAFILGNNMKKPSHCKQALIWARL